VAILPEPAARVEVAGQSSQAAVQGDAIDLTQGRSAEVNLVIQVGLWVAPVGNGHAVATVMGDR